MTSLTPDDLTRYIRENDIAAELLPMTVETPTVPAAAAALGVQPAQIVKSLLFLIRDQAVLVIACGDTQVDRRALADRYGVGKKQVKLADAGTVSTHTGYAVGGVPPFGHRLASPVLLDRAVSGWDVIYGGGGDDRTLLRITPDELARVTAAEWIDLGATPMNLQPAGVVLGVTAFVSIWLGHVAVRVLEYRMAWLPWPLFLLAGIAVEIGALMARAPLASGVLGIVGMTLLWDAIEFKRQEKRVLRGHAPANPRNPRHARLLIAADGARPA